MATVEFDVDGIPLLSPAWGPVVRRLETLSVPPWREGDLRIAGRVGAIVTPTTRDVGHMGLSIPVLPVDSVYGLESEDPTAQLLANIRTLQALCRGSSFDSTVTLTRRIGEDLAPVEAESQARVVTASLTPQIFGTEALLEPDFDLLDGFFYDVTPTAYSAGSGNIVMPGDDLTTKMTIAFSAAATLTNTTLGRVLTVAEACTVDVWAKTAVDGSMDPIPGTVLYDGPDLSWFALAPGTNALTVSAGTVTIAARAAYL